MDAETRNIVDPENAENNRTDGAGGYAFNAPILRGYEGHAIVFACVRLGDHAHIHVESGRAIVGGRETLDAQVRMGWAGKLTLRWPEWLLLCEIFDGDPRVWIAEVERPTKGMLDRYTADHAPRRSPGPAEAL